MKKLIIGLLFLGLTNLSFSQYSNNLLDASGFEEIVISQENFNYLNNVQVENTLKNVSKSEIDASKYHIKKAKNHVPYEETFEIIFNQSIKKITAIFDKNGEIINCYEKYSNVKSPLNIRKNIFKDNPDWLLHSDAYLVSYNSCNEVNKTYKV